MGKENQGGTFPETSGKSLDKAGIERTGYIDKKGTASGQDAMFNDLPPGEDITKQKTTDIRSQPYKEVVDLGYPGDGFGGD